MEQREIENRINIPPHQEVLDRPVVSSMNGNELFLCSISGSVTIKQPSGAKYYLSQQQHRK
jgi:hypothetical protein